MKRILEGLRSFLFDRRRKTARSVAACILAAAVMFSVAGSLVQPAVSLTEPTSTRGAGDGGSSDPENYDDVREVTNAYVIGKAPDSNSTGIYQVTAAITDDKDENSITKYHTKLSINFNLLSSVVQVLGDHSNSISFNIKELNATHEYPECFSLITDTDKLQGPVYTSGDDKQKIGKYVFNPETGEVKIKFDFDAAYFDGKQGQAIGGGFNVEAWMWSEDNSKEDFTVQLAGNEVTVPVYRYTHTPDLSVKKTYNNDFFYKTEGAIMGTGDQALRARGSSFTIQVKSNNGVNGTEVRFTDRLTHAKDESGNDKPLDIHFDLAKGAEWPLYMLDEEGEETLVTGAKVVIDEIEGDQGSEQTLSARIVADNEEVLKKGFDFYWRCPVTVNDEHIEDGKVKVDKVNGFTELAANNTVEASAAGVPTMSFPSSMQVGLIADIAKDAGKYDPETNTVEWCVKIYKDDGWWRNYKIEFDDLLGGDQGTPPEIVLRDDGHGGTELDMDLQIVRSAGNESDNAHSGSGLKEDPDPATNGVYPLQYDSTNGKFTINMVQDEEEWIGYNKVAVKEFIVTYRTKVTSEDYGDEINNWVALCDPDGGYNDVDPTAMASVDTPKVDKTHTMTDTGIDWTITIDNSKGQALGGLTVKDVLTGPDSQAIAVDFATIGATVNGQPLDSVFDVSGSSLTFKEGQSAASYVITYTQTVENMQEHSDDVFTNTAELDKDDKKLDEDIDEARIPKEAEIEKTGYIGADGKMHYTVTIVNLWGNDLQGKTVSDVLTITGKDGIDASDFVLELEGDNAANVTVDKSYEDNKLTAQFTVNESSTASRYEISYSVRPGSGNFITDYGYGLSNTAVLEPNIDTKQFQQYINKFVTLDYKDVNYDQSSNRDMFVWKIKLTNNYGFDLSKYPTAEDPYTLDDTMFGSGKIVSLKIIDADGNDIATAADLAEINANDHYTFKDGMDSGSYEFIYETKHIDEKNDSVENTVTYGDDTKSDSETNPWTVHSINKGATVGDADDSGRVLIRWSVSLSTTYGSMLTYEITDSMSAYENHKGVTAENENISHYLTPEQFNIDNFVFKPYYLYGPLVMGDSYDYNKLFELEATETDTDGNITEFKIKPKSFDEGTEEYEVLYNIGQLVVEYNATGTGVDEMRGEGFNNGDSVVYENGASFPRGETVGKASVDRRSPVVKYVDDFKNGGFTNESYKLNVGLSELDHNDQEGYYTVQYKLAVNEYKNFDSDTDIELTDTLPANTSLLDIRYGASGEVTEGAAESGKIKYELSGRELQIHISKSVHNGHGVDIIYTLKISDEDMEAMLSSTDNGTNGSALLDNTVQLGDEYDNIPLNVNDDVDLFTKTGQENGANSVKYTLDINPNARALNNGEDLTIRDTINLGANENGVQYAECPILFNQLNASNVKVYQVSKDGTRTLMDNSGFGFDTPREYTYPVKPKVIYQDGNPVSYELGYGDVYIFELSIPDETHIMIEYDYSFEFNAYVKAIDRSIYDDTTMKLKNSAVIDGTSHKDEKEESYNFNKNETSSATAYSAPMLKIRKVSSDNWLEGLPSAKFILERYNPDVDAWQTMKGKITVDNVKELVNGNKLNLNSVDFADFTGSGEDMVLVTQQSTSPEVPNGQVEIPNLQTAVEDQAGDMIFTYQTVSGTQAKYIFRLREIEAPSGYYFEEGEKDFYFYEEPKGSDHNSVYPTQTINDAIQHGALAEGTEIAAVRSGTKIELSNNPIALDIQKEWSDEGSAENAEEITVQLFKSSEMPANDGYHKVKLDLNNGGTHTQHEFFVLDGDTFAADVVLSAEGWSETGPGDTDTVRFVSYSNASGLPTYSIEGKTPVTADVQYTFYVNSLKALEDVVLKNDPMTPEQDGLPADAEKVGDDIKLNAANNWHADIPGSELEADKYYYIKETTPEGYSAYYLNNGLRRSGTFKLRNVKNELDVEKLWADSSSSARPEEISLKLYETDQAPAAGTVRYVKVDTVYGGSTYSNVYPVADGSEFLMNIVFEKEYETWHNNIYFSNGALEQKGSESYDQNEHTLVYQVKSKTAVTGDITERISFNMDNSYVLKKIEPACEIAQADAIDTDGLQPVKEFTLSAENGWKLSLDELDGVLIKSDKYYYVVEEVPDGYNVTYPVNGLTTGTLQLVNLRDSSERGSIIIDKQWLKDEEADVDKLTFEVRGYTEKVAQTESEYSYSTLTSDYVSINFKGGKNADIYSGDYPINLNPCFLAEPGKTYRLEVTGRTYFQDHVQEFTVGGTNGSFSAIGGNKPGMYYTVSVPDSAEGEIPVNIRIRYSQGISDPEWSSWSWNPAPTSDSYLFEVYDESNSPVTVYDSKDDLLAYLASHQTGPTSSYAEAVVTEPDDDSKLVYSGTVTVEKDGEDWTGRINGLPVKVNGQQVYYYIVEQGSQAYTPINYSSNAVSLSGDSDEKTVTVLNQKNDVTSYELPATGGEGPEKFFITGGALMLGAALFYIINKRKARSG